MDRPALEQELEALHAQSLAWALVCCAHDRADAEDALQSAYLRVLDGRARFEGRASFRTWLFGVIRRTAAEQRRPQRWWVRPHRNGADASALRDPAPAADAQLESAQRAARLQAALRRIAPRQQQVLELVFYHGLSIAEAGEVMGVALGTARIHYERGKKNLLRQLELEE